MIPKIIHYCWLSDDPYPPKIQKCIDSWKQHLGDYEIWLWDLSRFDINTSIWVKEAYEAKKYAFAADYIRCYALYHYGGIYLDSDVEVVKPFDDLLDLPYFLGFESAGYFEAATIGTESRNPLFGKLLEYYKDRCFIDENGEPDILIMPEIFMKIVNEEYRVQMINNISEFEYKPNVISAFPYDFFSPIDTQGRKYILRMSTNTYSIHHFASAWVAWEVKFLIRIFGNTSTMLKVKSVLSYFRKNLYKNPKNTMKSILNSNKKKTI